MMENLLGSLGEQQGKMKETLAAMTVEAESGDGAVKVQANAAGVLLNITLDKEKLAIDDLEQLEDLMLVAINRVMEQAGLKEAEESQKMVSNMLPPGMEGLGDMFK